jgi:hypothetical protein
LWSDGGADNQKWHFDDDLTIRSELGTVLEVKDGAQDNRSPLIAASKNGIDNQKFRVVPIQE